MTKKGRPVKDRKITSGGYMQVAEKRHRLDIILQSPSLFHFDIGSYMKAVESAAAIDMYNRTNLYDMYASAFLTDPHLIGIRRKRLVGSCRKPIEFVRDGRPDESIGELLSQPWFRRFRKEVTLSELWGFSLLQFYLDQDGALTFDSIDRKHYDPVRRLILRFQSDCEGAPLEAFSNTMVIGEDPRGLGIMAGIMPYVLYKRGNFGDWAQFCQIFGIPIREYTYDAGDEEARKRLLEDARRQGANAVYIHPKGSVLNLIESGNKTGSSDLFKELKDACNTEMSVAMLGNTLTTDAKATGTQALGTVHQEEEDEIKEDDENRIIETLNSASMRKILTALGYNVEGGRFQFIKAKETDKTTQLSVVTQLHEKLGLPIDDDYLYETFDIDKPDNYEQLKAEELKKEEQRQTQQEEIMRRLQEGGNKPGQKPAAAQPKNESDVAFWDKVKGFFSAAPQDGADCPF